MTPERVKGMVVILDSSFSFQAPQFFRPSIFLFILKSIFNRNPVIRSMYCSQFDFPLGKLNWEIAVWRRSRQATSSKTNIPLTDPKNGLFVGSTFVYGCTSATLYPFIPEISSINKVKTKP